MIVGIISVLAVQAATPPEDAVFRYGLCVSRMAAARAGNDPEDATAEVSAIACENLLSPAVEQVLAAASGTRDEAKRRVAALLENNARREAMARNAIVRSSKTGKP